MICVCYIQQLLTCVIRTMLNSIFTHTLAGAAEEITLPEVRLGWYEPWHPHGDARLAEHVTVVHPNSLPWEQIEFHNSKLETEHLDQALIYKGLDQRNMYHVMLETGNYIFATACKLLGACTYATSHYQIFSIVSLTSHALSMESDKC